MQNSGSTAYWNPEDPLRDDYKAVGFPQVPGLLTAAARPFAAPGLRTPWYSTAGNHDDSVEGTLPDLGLLTAVYTGGLKLEGVDDADAARLADAIQHDPSRRAHAVRRTPGRRRPGPARHARRAARAVRPRRFAKAHLDPARTGPGPYGHGFTADAADSGELYYTFPISEDVLGISLDTTNRAGLADGSIGTAQLDWLESRLRASAATGTTPTATWSAAAPPTGSSSMLSHHTSTTMGNLLPDPYHLLEERHSGDELVALLQRYPNVVAWVNGHTHAQPDHPAPAPGARARLLGGQHRLARRLPAARADHRGRRQRATGRCRSSPPSSSPPPPTPPTSPTPPTPGWRRSTGSCRSTTRTPRRPRSWAERPTTTPNCC